LSAQGIGVVAFHLLDALRKQSLALLRPCGEAVLRIGIESGDGSAQCGEFSRQVPRNRRFPDPALSPGNYNDSHGEYYTVLPAYRA